MGNLSVLLLKDLRRNWRNPWPWLLNLIIPLAMTALIGGVFSGPGAMGPLPRVRFAVVNNDKSLASDFLVTSVRRWKDGQVLDIVPMSRPEAESALSQNDISGIVVIPEHFAHRYFAGRDPAALELIKNPAESIGPTVLEELTNVLVAMLNVVARNFPSELYQVNMILNGHGLPNLDGEKTRAKFDLVARYLNPTRIAVETVEPPPPGGNPVARPAGAGAMNISGFILIGMSTMFLLFLANNTMGDLHTEFRLGTFRRYQSLHHSAVGFVAAKIVFTVLTLLLASALMLGGGGWAFGLAWRDPVAMIVLIFGYAWFVAALVALLVSLAPDARRASVLSIMVGMTLGMIGGCMVPPEVMPAFMRDTILPYTPTNWFASAMRGLQSGATEVPAAMIASKLAGVGLVCLIAAALLLRARLRRGPAS